MITGFIVKTSASLLCNIRTRIRKRIASFNFIGYPLLARVFSASSWTSYVTTTMMLKERLGKTPRSLVDIGEGGPKLIIIC